MRALLILTVKNEASFVLEWLAHHLACGFDHVTWSLAGTLDNTPLATSLKNIAQADILLAHLGIWSRKDPWAPAVLEPLITGLQARGFCFKTLREHPQYKAWIDSRMGAATAVPAK